jgi:hypothetical protein
MPSGIETKSSLVDIQTALRAGVHYDRAIDVPLNHSRETNLVRI